MPGRVVSGKKNTKTTVRPNGGEGRGAPRDLQGPDRLPFYCIKNGDGDGYYRNAPLHQGAARTGPNIGESTMLGVLPSADPGTGNFTIGAKNPLFHGFIENIGEVNVSFTGKNAKFRCFFLYNPDAVEESFGFNPGTAAGSDNTPEAAGSGGYSNQSSASLVLFFDRTFESYLGNKFVSNETHAFHINGVRNDTLLLQQMLGIGLTGDSPETGPGVFAAGSLNSLAKIRVCLDRYSRFTYSGYVNALSVKYTHFTRDMVPTRAIVNITIQQIHQTPTAAGTGETGETGGTGGTLAPQGGDPAAGAGLGSDVTLPASDTGAGLGSDVTIPSTTRIRDFKVKRIRLGGRVGAPEILVARFLEADSSSSLPSGGYVYRRKPVSGAQVFVYLKFITYVTSFYTAEAAARLDLFTHVPPEPPLPSSYG